MGTLCGLPLAQFDGALVRGRSTDRGDAPRSGRGRRQRVEPRIGFSAHLSMLLPVPPRCRHRRVHHAPIVTGVHRLPVGDPRPGLLPAVRLDRSPPVGRRDLRHFPPYSTGSRFPRAGSQPASADFRPVAGDGISTARDGRRRSRADGPTRALRSPRCRRGPASIGPRRALPRNRCERGNRRAVRRLGGIRCGRG